jgi:hypothetical protein
VRREEGRGKRGGVKLEGKREENCTRKFTKEIDYRAVFA